MKIHRKRGVGMIQIIHADVMDGLRQIPDQTVQCVVTSPPYWGLRDYSVDGQIGLEKTPEEFIQKMVEVFRGVRRVLRDDGTVWLNLGDCYATNGVYIKTYKANHPEHQNLHTKHSERYQNKKGYRDETVKAKDLIGMPWRVAFALQADGWYLRSDIIWSKPNPMPESVTDRPTKSHEYIFLLTKKARYYYDADAVREPLGEWSKKALVSDWSRKKYRVPPGKTPDGMSPERGWGNGYGDNINPAGRNRRTVWEIATQPFPMAHFATFPEALVEPCIKAGTSERGCCSVCGAPWVRVVERTIINREGWGASTPDHKTTQGTHGPSARGEGWCGDPQSITIGWQPSCKCWEYVSDTGERNQFPADTVPCIVLDPFGGSGTVGKVARDLNRKAILIELNAEYIKIAKERLRLNEQLGAFA
jgi:DNA modification methylase